MMADRHARRAHRAPLAGALVRGALRPRADHRRPRDPDARPRAGRSRRVHVPHAPAGRAPTAPFARSSRARSCTSCAAASSPRCKRHPAHALLRRGRHDGALPAAGLRARHVDRRPRVLRAAARAHVDAALRWIDEYGDLDGDGFVEYRRRSRAGLREPGLARRRRRDRARRRHAGPRAPSPWPSRRPTSTTPSAAWRAIFGQLGDVELAERLQAESQRPQAALQRALLDGGRGLRGHGPRRREAPGAAPIGLDHRPLPVVAHRRRGARARRWCERLMAPDMFSGWGVRTMAKTAAAYSPMSFYNGSVWPYDNALIVNGLKKHGFTPGGQPPGRGAVRRRRRPAVRAPARVLLRLHAPGGQPAGRPTPWPARPTPRRRARCSSCCRPCSGIYASAAENVLYVHNPLLPKWLGEVTLSNLERGPLQAAACASAATATSTTFSVPRQAGRRARRRGGE